MSANGSSPEYDQWRAQGWICAGDAVKELHSLGRGVSRQTLHNWRKAGKVEAQLIIEGNREFYLFKREDLELPPVDDMPSEALDAYQQFNVEMSARAEVTSEVMLEKLNPFLEDYTRQVLEGVDRGRQPFLEKWEGVTKELSRLADSQERIAEALEKERRPWWRFWD